MSNQEAEDETDLLHSSEERELRDLLAQANAGNRQAYMTLLKRIEAMLHPYVRNKLTRAGQGSGGAEEDIVQEVLLGIHSKRHTYDPSQPFLPWVYAIARFKTIDYLRFADVRKGTSSLDDPEGRGPALAATTGDPGDQLDVQRGLDLLPDKQRELIRMVKINGFSVQEASLKTGFSPTDIRVSIHRGLQTLKKKLARTRV